MARRNRIAIVDDHPMVRRGLAETFDEADDFEVIGEGASAADAVAIARDKKPNVVLLDITMPGGGVEAARDIAKFCPDVCVIAFTIREELAVVQSALRAGARGYILKGTDGEELLSNVRRIIDGQSYVSPELAARLIAGDLGAPAPPPASERIAALSEREGQIFRLMGEGLTNQEIAERLGLRENTVKHYITPMMQKLGVRNRTEAALLARGAK
jgi:two-component system, NarL family, nitrate/nitrite response regulator NarL